MVTLKLQALSQFSKKYQNVDYKYNNIEMVYRKYNHRYMYSDTDTVSVINSTETLNF